MFGNTFLKGILKGVYLFGNTFLKGILKGITLIHNLIAYFERTDA